MTTTLLETMFAHNTWATLRIIDTCAGLPDDQLDALPIASSDWSVRRALTHLVASERAYVSLLTLPPDARRHDDPPVAALRAAAQRSGDELLALARAADAGADPAPLRTTDGYDVEPRIVLVQAINHATDHRRQIAGLLKALGVTPPDVDGWSYGLATGALVPIAD